MLGKTVPMGGLAWQEVQFAKLVGVPAWWQVMQVGADTMGEAVPVCAWQVLQLVVKAALELMPVCEVPRNGIA
jgi:hypothetical protein